MMLGLSLSAFTTLHVIISLLGLVAGIVMLVCWVRGERAEGWTTSFLVTTIATSATGFGFPFDRFLPSHWTGVISLCCSPSP